MGARSWIWRTGSRRSSPAPSSSLLSRSTASGIAPRRRADRSTSPMSPPLLPGKLPPELLAALLAAVATDDPRVLVGPRDSLLLTKATPLEATSILARERRAALLGRGWSPEALDRAAAALYDPGISIVREAWLAVAQRAATAMHDPTEGGLATGLRE